MNDERLRELLKSADAAAPPGDVPGLAHRVRGLHRRRRITQVAGLAMPLIIGVLVVLVHLARPPATPIAQEPAVDIDAIARQIAALETKAAYHAELAERMWQAETQAHRLARAERVIATVAPLRRIDRELDRAAMQAILDGDRLLRELNLRNEAAAEYRRTIELFPDSHWAAVAKDRLEQIENGKEG